MGWYLSVIVGDLHHISILVQQAKQKWKNLSDGFKKCLDRKRDMEKSGSGYSKPPTFRFYNQLQSLQNSVSNRTTRSNIQVIRCDSPDSPCPLETTLPDQSVAQFALPILSPASDQKSDKQQVTPNADHPPGKQKSGLPQATVVPKRKKKVELDPVEQFLIKSIDKKDQENTSEDPDEQFCRSIADTLRRFRQNSMKKNQFAKIKIQQLLFDIEFSDSDNF